MTLNHDRNIISHLNLEAEVTIISTIAVYHVGPHFVQFGSLVAEGNKEV
jgi:hypothetical protein